MHYRDERPVAATAIVVAVVLGLSALVRLVNAGHERNIVQQHPPTLFVIAGE
jgi:hypothetical protein